MEKKLHKDDIQALKFANLILKEGKTQREAYIKVYRKEPPKTKEDMESIDADASRKVRSEKVQLALRDTREKIQEASSEAFNIQLELMRGKSSKETKRKITDSILDRSLGKAGQPIEIPEDTTFIIKRGRDI